MIAYKFDGTKNGLLCCLFEAFTCHENPIIVTSDSIQQSFDMEIKEITTDREKAERVALGLNAITSGLCSRIMYILRSYDLQKETVAFSVAKLCLEKRKSLLLDFSNPLIMQFSDLVSKINREAMRLKGFIRFEESVDGIWYSHFEPDNDVIDLIAPHFAKRLNSENFLLHDIKRNKLIAYNKKELHAFEIDKPITVFLSNKELEIKGLWQNYYQSVNIVERRNDKLRRCYLPRRYEKHMSECNHFYSPLFKLKKP